MDRYVGVATVVTVGFVAALVVAGPVQFSYVYSDSMEPTLQRYDAYAVYETSSVGVGDVVVFRSSHGDEYVTHRIVGETERGFVTKGDANPSTDQAAGYDHVESSQVVGRVVTVGGGPVVVPGLGMAIERLRAHAVAVGVVAVLAVLYVGGRSDDGRERSVVRVDDVVRPLFAAALVSAVVFGVAGSQAVDVTYVAVEHHDGGSRTMQVGEPRTETIRIDRARLPGTRTLATGDGVEVVDRQANATTREVTVRVSAPSTIGPHGGVLRISRYPVTLPPALLRSLVGIHPGLASLASALSILGPLYLAYCLGIDGRTPVRPSRRRWVHAWFGGEE